MNVLSQTYLSLTSMTKKKEEYLYVYFLLPMTYYQSNDILGFQGEVKKLRIREQDIPSAHILIFPNKLW